MRWEEFSNDANLAYGESVLVGARCSVLELISEEALSPSICMPASTTQEFMVPCQLMSVYIFVGSEFRKLTCICSPMHICNGV